MTSTGVGFPLFELLTGVWAAMTAATVFIRWIGHSVGGAGQ